MFWARGRPEYTPVYCSFPEWLANQIQIVLSRILWISKVLSAPNIGSRKLVLPYRLSAKADEKKTVSAWKNPYRSNPIANPPDDALYVIYKLHSSCHLGYNYYLTIMIYTIILD